MIIFNYYKFADIFIILTGIENRYYIQYIYPRLVDGGVGIGISFNVKIK